MHLSAITISPLRRNEKRLPGDTLERFLRSANMLSFHSGALQCRLPDLSTATGGSRGFVVLTLSIPLRSPSVLSLRAHRIHVGEIRDDLFAKRQRLPGNFNRPSQNLDWSALASSAPLIRIQLQASEKLGGSDRRLLPEEQSAIWRTFRAQPDRVSR